MACDTEHDFFTTQCLSGKKKLKANAFNINIFDYNDASMFSSHPVKWYGCFLNFWR